MADNFSLQVLLGENLTVIRKPRPWIGNEIEQWTYYNSTIQTNQFTSNRKEHKIESQSGNKGSLGINYCLFCSAFDTAWANLPNLVYYEHKLFFEWLHYSVTRTSAVPFTLRNNVRAHLQIIIVVSRIAGPYRWFFLASKH